MAASAIQLIPHVALAAAHVAIEQGPEIVVSSETIDRDWDAFLAATPGGHHVQTSLWAQLKATLGWRVLRLTAKDAGRIVGGVQILLRDYGRRMCIGYITKGPVFSTAGSRMADLLQRELVAQVRAHRLQCMFIQPAAAEPPSDLLRQSGFHPTRIPTFLQATTVLDLTPPLDDILMGMKRKTRRNVRQSLGSGLQVRCGNEDDLDAFYNLFMATASRKGFRDYSKSYFQQLWKLFAPTDQIRLFLVEKKGEPVSAALRLAFGDTVVCKKRGWSGEHAELRPNEAAEWAAICWAKEAGYRYYDFEGIPLRLAETVLRGEPIPEENVQSPASYKLGFGGEVRILPDSLVRFSNPLACWGHRVVYPCVAHWPIIDRVVSRFKVS